MIKRGIFKLQFVNGKLEGTYSNEQCNSIDYPSSAIKETSNNNQNEFVGTYQDTWVESNSVQYSAALEIILINKNIYLLKWNGEEGRFEGVAQREGGTLYGTYISV